MAREHDDRESLATLLGAWLPPAIGTRVSGPCAWQRRTRSLIVHSHSPRDGPWTIKMALRDDGAHRPAHGIGLQKECAIARRVARVVATPRISSHVTCRDGGPIAEALVMERIAGCAARTCFARGSLSLQREIVARFGEMLRALHTIRYPRWGLIGNDGEVRHEPGSYYAYLAARQAAKRTQLHAVRVAVPCELTREPAADVRRGLTRLREFRLVHGDLTPTGTNYLLAIAHGRPVIAAVFDFEWARAGHPYEDLAKAWINTPSQLASGLLDAYWAGAARSRVFGFQVRVEALVKASWLARRSVPAARAFLADITQRLADLGSAEAEEEEIP